MQPFSPNDLVRSTNELYRPLGIGRVCVVQKGYATVEFSPSVFMEPPYRAENKILRLTEMEQVDSPLERARRRQWDEPWRFEARILAARFLTGSFAGQLSNARAEIAPHQIFAAHRVTSSARRRLLVADEAPTHRILTAGVIWQALDQLCKANRTLIVTPAGLAAQWKEGLLANFGARFDIFGLDFTAVNPWVWDMQARAIASPERLLRRPGHRILVDEPRWDLIIFDEAHRLSAMDYGSQKIDKTLNYRLAEELKNQCYSNALLLLTATPHQGEENHCRFKHLLYLLEENIDFSGLEEMNLFSGSGTRFTELVIRTPKKDVTDAEGRKVFRGRQTHRMPFKMYDDEAKFYKAVAKYIQSGYKMLDRLNDPARRRAAGFLLTTFQKLNASSTSAIKSALETRLKRLRGEIADLPEEDEPEPELFDERFEGEQDEAAVLMDDREVMEHEAETLEKLIRMRVREDKKLHELLQLIDHIAAESPEANREKVLIFTEYRQTQRHLVEQLEAKYGKGSAVVIHGGMKLERIEETEQEIEAIWSPFARDGALVAPSTKRTSQRLFRDRPDVRFLVSTEAGGEGINLQFCHICVNYDLPWNPMRVEQRVGRVYRFGQTKVVQVYNFFNAGTIEDTVQEYFEGRLTHAAEAIAKVTGESPEDIKGTLNGQLESEIDPAKIYQRAMVEGNLNKQTKEEIEEAVKRARKAYEIATRSLFRDASSYSFDSYRRELATDLTLTDLERFTEKFLAAHRRQMQRKSPFVEFLVPDVLARFKLRDRYRGATFDRELAIQRRDAEFLALGHPFVNAMLAHAGSYDFGGLATTRQIRNEPMAGRAGWIFAFVVRQRISREGDDECLFRFEPVFVDAAGHVDPCAAEAAIGAEAISATTASKPTDVDRAFQIAKEQLEGQDAVWDWEDDVEFLGVSWVEFT